ncbi:hypothetical protein D1641_16160 [Colidextribacter sp. OB.20]|uniref:hypothetical protein n=1 Tax=Colidextribacter sp. OB.20 TaxID=2304568 RepID=UPI00136C1762|nr:hypothetical protein [Colidextribacter sp. OB.20]NBI11524.1 hypothetical protein [Colidextribacter sp. OB.20]
MNKFLEMKERGETILFSDLLEDIPPNYVLVDLFPNKCNPAHLSVSRSALEVLKLRLKGFTQLEIAEQLGLSPSQVASRAKDVKNTLYMDVPSYFRIDIPALGKILNVPIELTGYKLLSELLRDMPSDEELMRLFIERGATRGGKLKLAPTNKDLQLLQMRTQKQSYDSIGKAMGMEPKEVRHQISLTLHRISRDLQIELDIPELFKPRMPSPQPEQVKDPELEKEKRLSILSDCQREVWELYEQGKNKSQIAKLLGKSYSVVAEHIRSAERRFREYDHYCAVEERNKERAFLSLTRGEVKIIIKALALYERELEQDITRRTGDDWIGKLPYECQIVADLYDKAQTVIYGKPITRMVPNINEE